MVVHLGDEIKIAKSSSPKVTVNWQENIKPRSKEFYCIPFSVGDETNDANATSSLFCEIGLVKKLISSATEVSYGNEIFLKIKITNEFRYGQDYSKNTRFLVYGDKSDNIPQNQFIPSNERHYNMEEAKENEKGKLWMESLSFNISQLFNAGDSLREFYPLDSRPILSVLQFNIQSGTGKDGKYDLLRTAEVINNLAPDLVSVQEIEIKCSKDCYGKELTSQERKDSNQPLELSNLTGLKYYFEEKTNQFGGSYGTAAFTKLNVLKEERISFISWDKHHGSDLLFGKLPQVAVLLKVHYEGWKLPVWFVSVHLGCDASGTEQYHEIQELLIFINQLRDSDEEKSHVIISGDFNCLPMFDAVKSLSAAGYQDCWQTAKEATGGYLGGTFPINAPILRLDYVFATLDIEVVLAKVINSNASDHLPLFVQLKEKLEI